MKARGAVLFLFFAIFLLAIATATAHAQYDRINFSAGVGFTSPTETASNKLNTGWNLDFRGGYNATRHLDLDLDFSYNHFGLTNAALAQFGEPGGDVSTWDFTFQPAYHILPRRSRANAYVTSGFGIYHRNLTLTQPAVINTFVCDFFFGCFPTTISVNQVVASFDTYKPGWNAGGGFEFRLGDRRTKLFTEARYTRMFTTNGHDLTYVPVTFGLRW